MDPADTDRSDPPEIPEGWDPRGSKQASSAAKSYNYYPWDEVLSALQKAVRRGWLYDAVYWAMEAFFSGLGATLTNAWNRLLVMALEDVGAANPSLLPLIVYHAAHNRENKYVFAACAHLLAASPKTRVNDWAANYRAHFPEIGGLRGSRLEEAMKHLAQASGSAAELQAHLTAALQIRDFFGALRCAQLLRFHEEAVRGRRRKAEYGIVRAFEEVIGAKSPYLRVCVGLALANNWRWKSKALLVYTHVITLWCHNRWDAAEAAAAPEATLHEARVEAVRARVQELVDEHERGGMPLLGVPDLALDKHTARGKRMGRGFADFVNVGSVLANEDPEWQELARRLRAGAEL
jgi:hypothetical protein